MSKPRVELKRGEFCCWMWRNRGAGDPGILIFWGLLINVVDSVMFCGCVISGSGGRWDFGV